MRPGCGLAERGALFRQLESQPYILDIDLDYFAEVRPGAPPWSRAGACGAVRSCRRWTSCAVPQRCAAELKVEGSDGLHQLEHALLAEAGEPAPRELATAIRSLEDMLAGAPRPALVTVARSVDRYLPITAVPTIEAAVFQMLTRLWDPERPDPRGNRTLCASYGPGTAHLDQLRRAVQRRQARLFA